MSTPFLCIGRGFGRLPREAETEETDYGIGASDGMYRLLTETGTSGRYNRRGIVHIGVR
jgi:hypothetical protein